MFYFFLSWLAGMAGLFFYFKNINNALRLNDVLFTYILSGFVGIVFSIAASKLNISFWMVYVAFVGFSAFITYKFIDKSKVVATAPLGAFASGRTVDEKKIPAWKAFAVLGALAYGFFAIIHADNARVGGNFLELSGIIVLAGLFIGGLYLFAKDKA